MEVEIEPVTPMEAEPVTPIDNSGKKKKKVMIGGIIAILILSLMLTSVFLLFGSISFSPEIHDINVIQQSVGPGGHSLEDQIYYKIYVGSAGIVQYSGSVDISITYTLTNSNVYMSTLDIKKGEASFLVAYDKFCTGNGDYMITARSGGISDSDEFEISSIVQYLNVTAFLSATDHNRANVTVFMEDSTSGSYMKEYPSPFTYEMVVSFEDSSSPVYTTTGERTSRDNSGKWGMQINESFEKGDRGNYTIVVTVTNLMVKGSPLVKTVTDSVTVYLNTPPIANAGPDQSKTIGYLDTTATFTLDATSSYDPDGIITSYLWDLGDGTGQNPNIYAESIFDQNDGEDNDNDGTIDEKGEAADGSFDGKYEYTYVVAGTKEFTVTLWVYDGALNEQGEAVVGSADMDTLTVTISRGL